MPPDNRDFVSWFLLDERQGYCTSFATAMAVMARMVGLPSRYVEGYAATPDADGVARVTQQNAHAWVEIYFTGFGWLPFDPTPGIGNSEDGDSSSDDPQSNPPTPSPSPSPTPTPNRRRSPNGSTPTPSPSPTPSPDAEDAADTPAPSPTPEVSPSPPPGDNEPPRNPPPAWLWPMLILLLIALAATLRLFFCAPAQVAKRQKNANDALLVWYRAAEDALLCMGLSSLPGEAPASFPLARPSASCMTR